MQAMQILGADVPGAQLSSCNSCHAMTRQHLLEAAATVFAKNGFFAARVSEIAKDAGVADGTGVHQYTIDHVLQNMIDRCKELQLRVTTPKREARRRVMIVLTVQVMNVLHSGYHRIAV